MSTTELDQPSQNNPTQEQWLAMLKEKEVEIQVLKKQQRDFKELQKSLRLLHNNLDEMQKYLSHSGIKGILRTLLAPRLGKLFQYESGSPVIVPTRYHQKAALKNPPLFSIVTPSYNQGAYIERTIRSVLDQAYPRLEYIIQDGASNDQTPLIIEKYKEHFKHAESVNDQGQSQAINLGFRHASGEIMAYLNSDDILLPGTLHYVAHYFENHPEVDAVYGHRILIDSKDFEIGRWTLPPHCDQALIWADYIPQETLFWRRSLWEKTGAKIDESFKFAMDWDLLLRFQRAGARFARLPRFLGAFRVHKAQKTLSEMSEVGAQEIAILRNKHHGRDITNAEVCKKIRWYLMKHVFYHKLNRAGLIQY